MNNILVGDMIVGGERMIATTLLVILSSSLIDGALAESPQFIVEPNIISKTLLGKPGVLTLSLITNFSAINLGSKPLEVYLSTTGGTSDNAVCINAGNNLQPQPKLAFGSAKGETVTVLPRDGQVIFNNMALSLTITVDQINCPDNQLPFIRSATLKDIELHIINNVDNISTLNC